MNRTRAIPILAKRWHRTGCLYQWLPAPAASWNDTGTNRPQATLVRFSPLVSCLVELFFITRINIINRHINDVNVLFNYGS